MVERFIHIEDVRGPNPLGSTMNVVFFTRSFYPNIGGVEKHIYKLTEELSKKNLEIVIFTEKSYSNNYQSSNKSAKSIGITNVQIIEVNSGKDNWFKKFRIWLELAKNLDIIRKADIVHCHDVYFWYMPFRFIFPNKKIFVTFHGYEGNKIPGFKAIAMHKIAELMSDGNISIGKFLSKWYKTKATVISYGAVDKKIINSNNYSSAKNTKGIFIGRLERETGILEYLKAIKIINGKKINFSLDIYGDGSLKEQSVSYVEMNKLPVNFFGFRNEIENILPQYDFAFVSRYLSILESMAARLPVFAHYNNEIKKDYLEMTPFAKYIFISNDSAAIAKRLSEYILNKKSDKEKAFLWVKDKTWNYMANIYLNLWSLNSKNK